MNTSNKPIRKNRNEYQKIWRHRNSNKVRLQRKRRYLKIRDHKKQSDKRYRERKKLKLLENSAINGLMSLRKS